jgi:hypothetical protein
LARRWRYRGLLLLCGFPLSTTGDGFQDYSLGSGIATDFLIAMGLIWLIDPIHEYPLREGYCTPNRADMAAEDLLGVLRQAQPARHWLELPSKFFLSTAILSRHPSNLSKVSNIPSPPTNPRWSFVRRCLVRAFCLFILADAAEIYLSYFPLFSQADAHSPSTPLLGQITDCISFVAQGTRAFAMLSMPAAIFGAISVATGLSEPQYWPKVFGHWRDAYTVRRFWG